MPLVGRGCDMESVLGHLDAPGTNTVAVSGPPGIGKSSLLDAIADRLVAGNRHVHRADGVAEGAAHPLAPFSHLLHPDDGSSSGVDEAIVRLVNRLAAPAGPVPPVLVLDDAHLLDEASLVVVHQLVRHRRVQVLMAYRSTERLPDALFGLLESAAAAAVTLEPLDRPAIHELARRTLDGEVSDEVVDELWRFSDGVPFYARDLLLGAREAGTVELRRGRWSATGRLAPSDRFSDALAARVGRLGVGGEEVVRSLAVGGPTSSVVLDRVVPAGARRAAERAGLTRRARRLDGTERSEFTHALYAETVRRWLDDAEVATQRRRLVASLSSARTADDVLQRAVLLHELGGGDPAWLADGAQVALRRFDATLALELSRSSLGRGAGPGAALVEAAALGMLGRHDEAESVFATLSNAATDDAARAAVVCARSIHLLNDAGRPDSARQLLLDASTELEQRAAAGVRGQLVTVSFYLGDPVAALAAGSDWLDGTELPPLNALPGLVSSLSVTGRPDEAQRLIEAAPRCPDEGPADWATLHANLVWNRLLVEWQRGRLAELRSPVDDLGPLLQLPVASAWLLDDALVGSLLQLRGALTEASRRIRGHLQRLMAGPVQVATFNLLLWATMECQRGDAGNARQALSLLARYPTPVPPAFEWWRHRAEAHLLAVDGRPGEAVRASLDAAERFRDLAFYRTTSLHDVVRFGRPDAVVDVLAEQAGRPGATWWDRVTAGHASAAATADVGALIEAGRRFDAGGTRREALECYLEVRRLAGTPDASTRDRVLAASCQEVVEELMAWCGTVWRAGAPATPVLLTDREAAVARLAATGRSNAQIAEHLGTSVRTVGNQLQRVYDKLGVHRRSELAALVDGH